MLCSAAVDDAATAANAVGASEVKAEEARLLSPAVNTDAPLLDDSVRCRMAGICEGLDACHRGTSKLAQSFCFACCTMSWFCCVKLCYPGHVQRVAMLFWCQCSRGAVKSHITLALLGGMSLQGCACAGVSNSCAHSHEKLPCRRRLWLLR